MVAIYELIGTAFLVFAILVSGGDAVAVSMSVFIIILVLAPITGAHMNPAVTIGVYVAGVKYGEDLLFFIIILLAECLGGLLGIGWAIGSLYSEDLSSGNKIIP